MTADGKANNFIYLLKKKFNTAVMLPGTSQYLDGPSHFWQCFVICITITTSKLYT